MDIYKREQSRVAAPVKPYMELDAGALDVKDAALSFAFVLGALLVALLGAFILKLSFTDDYWNFLSGGFGLVVALVAIAMAYGVLALTLTRWKDHNDRLNAWNVAGLSSYVNAGGVLVSEDVTEYSFSADNPLHIVWVALEIQRRIDAGEDTPWSVRQLRGPMFFCGRRVGEISKMQAERIAQRLAALGLIGERREGYAGVWRPRNADSVLMWIRKGWKA